MFSPDHVGVVFFDVDGTLVPGTSSSVILAGFLGHRDELAKAEDAYASGAVDNWQVSELDAAGWAGVSEDQVPGWLDGLPLVSGIAATVAWCWQDGLVPVLATLAWSPVGSYLTDRFGFHTFSGPRLEIADGRFTGRVAQHIDEYAKRDFALAQVRELGLVPRSCGAVGDSRSDLPLFASVGLSVAFNASAAAREAATATVDDDLRSVLPVLSAWLQPLVDGRDKGRVPFETVDTALDRVPLTVVDRVRVVGVGDRLLSQRSDVRFDHVHPRDVDPGEAQLDLVSLRPATDVGALAGVQVVRDHVDRGTVGPDGTERFHRGQRVHGPPCAGSRPTGGRHPPTSGGGSTAH